MSVYGKPRGVTEKMLDQWGKKPCILMPALHLAIFGPFPYGKPSRDTLGEVRFGVKLCDWVICSATRARKYSSCEWCLGDTEIRLLIKEINRGRKSVNYSSKTPSLLLEDAAGEDGWLCHQSNQAWNPGSLLLPGDWLLHFSEVSFPFPQKP